MSFIKNVIQKLRNKNSRVGDIEDEYQAQERARSKLMSSNERELERFMEEQREQDIKKELDYFRKRKAEQDNRNFMLDNKNIFNGHKELFKNERSIFF